MERRLEVASPEAARDELSEDSTAQWQRSRVTSPPKPSRQSFESILKGALPIGMSDQRPGKIPDDIAVAITSVTDRTTHPSIVQALEYSAKFPIHPIFDRHQWPYIETNTYVRMLPALVIATRLLANERACNFFYALLKGPRTEIVDHKCTPRTGFSACEWQDKDVSLPPKAQAEVDDLLQERLPRLVTMHLHRYEGIRGVARPVSDQPRSSGSSGAHCRIELHRNLLVFLRHNLEDGAYNLQCRKWFELATTLIHEVSHVASMEVYGYGEEMFFEGDPYIEMGYALESCIFGGVPYAGFTGNKECHLFVLAMPSTVIADSHNLVGQPWPLRAEPSTCFKCELVGGPLCLHDVLRMIYGPEQSRELSLAGMKTTAQAEAVNAGLNNLLIREYRQRQESEDRLVEGTERQWVPRVTTE